MEKRRDQPISESKTRVVVRVNLSLSSGDYSSALVLLRGAAAEFPNDAELCELEKLAQDGVKRKAEAHRLITESQELFAQQKSAEAIQLLRQAYDLDKNNALARTILANALVEHAHSIVETDWWEAETLANEALAFNPAHPTAKTIPNLVFDKKTAGSVEEWVSQTRKLQSSGNLSAALSQIAEGLVVYPHDAILLQIQDVIQRDHGIQRRQARRRDLEDLRRMDSEIDAIADVSSKSKLAERIQALINRYSTDGEILSVGNGLLNRLELVEFSRRSAETSPESEDASLNDHAVSRVVETSLEAPSPVPPSPILPSEIPPSPITQENIPASVIAPSVIASSMAAPEAIAPDVVASSVAASSSVVSSVVVSSVAPPGRVPTRVMPPDNVLSAPPDPQPPAPPAPAVPAEPSAPAAKVTSQSSSSSSEPEQAARSNSTMLTLVAAAAAIILIATISYFAGTHHAAPIANNPTAAPSGAAPTGSDSAGSNSAVSGSAGSDSAGSASSASSAPVSAPTQTTAEPSLPAVQPSSETAAGKVRPDVEEPPQQKIQTRKGEETGHVFNPQPQNLQRKPEPQPRLASLIIQSGAPGTAVLVDQTLVGTIQSDGTFSDSTVSPGDHTVELRRERFKPRQFKKHFDAGGAIAFAAADSALEAAPGELKIIFAPADANVAIAKAGGLPMIVSSGVPINLAAGAYTITARTADRFTRSSTLEVDAGESKTLDLSLTPNGMSKWDDPGAWKHEGDTFTRKGGDYVLYGVVPASGSFAFSAMLTKGRLLQWVLNYTDPKNYVLFQMDENNFYRTVIRNGAKTDQIIVPDKGDKKSFRDHRIRVSPTEIVHQIRDGNSWRVLDRWTQPGTNLSQGKFGFYIPGNDEVELSSFAHYADLNIR